MLERHFRDKPDERAYASSSFSSKSFTSGCFSDFRTCSDHSVAGSFIVICSSLGAAGVLLETSVIVAAIE